MPTTEKPAPTTPGEIAASLRASLHTQLLACDADDLEGDLDHLAINLANNAVQALMPLSEIATAAVRWAIAERVADASADLVNQLEKEEKAWVERWDSKGGELAGPSLTANTVAKIRKELEIAKLALADACCVEAAADKALHAIALQMSPAAPKVEIDL